MCDFPNVENNDWELMALGTFCDDWNRRIGFLPELFSQGHKDEALILCCCYIESIGNWFYKKEDRGKEVFARALIQHGQNEVFGMINPGALIAALEPDEWEPVLKALAPALDRFEDKYYPENEITAACDRCLPEKERTLLDGALWRGSLAALAHKVTRCEGIYRGSFSEWNCRGITLDFQVFYPALKAIFERARRLLMSGKLKIW